MVNYQESKIYKIVDNTTGNVYYGSTTEKYLSSRLSGHRFNFKKNRPGSANDIIKNDDYDMILLELFPCNNKDELLKRERYWIENNKCVNIKIPYRTQKERYDIKKEEQKKIYKDKKDERLLYQKKHNAYQKSWGGDLRSNNNNLLRIKMDLFH